MIGTLPKGGKEVPNMHKKRVNYLMFVQTYFGTCAIIILVTPNTLYSFATPHKTKYLLLKGQLPRWPFLLLENKWFLPFVENSGCSAGPHL